MEQFKAKNSLLICECNLSDPEGFNSTIGAFTVELNSIVSMMCAAKTLCSAAEMLVYAKIIAVKLHQVRNEKNERDPEFNRELREHFFETIVSYCDRLEAGEKI